MHRTLSLVFSGYTQEHTLLSNVLLLTSKATPVQLLYPRFPLMSPDACSTGIKDWWVAGSSNQGQDRRLAARGDVTGVWTLGMNTGAGV